MDLRTKGTFARLKQFLLTFLFFFFSFLLLFLLIIFFNFDFKLKRAVAVVAASGAVSDSPKVTPLLAFFLEDKDREA